MCPETCARCSRPSSTSTPDAVLQHGSETKWIKSLTVTMKAARLDAAGGSYSSIDRHIWVGGKQKPEQVAATVRHEVGHAIDERIGWTTAKRYEAPEHGGWKLYRDAAGKRALIDELLTATASPVLSWTGPVREWADEALLALLDRWLFADHQTEVLAQKIGATGDGSKTSQFVKELFASEAFRVIDRLRLSDAWNSGVGGAPLGERVYRKNHSYNQWMSFDLAARDTKVSNYQFYAPEEWFAELYSHYYATKPRGKELAAPAKASIEAILKVGEV